MPPPPCEKIIVPEIYEEEEELSETDVDQCS
jgi:hypothetical protein